MLAISESNSTQLQYIPSGELPAVWRAAWWFLAPAVAGAEEMAEASVCSKIATGKLHLFMVYDGDRSVGAATLSITETDFQKVATIVHLGGDFDRMVPHFEDLKSWARAHGAKAFRIWGRKGWLKKAAPLGFKEKFFVMEAQI